MLNALTAAGGPVALEARGPKVRIEARFGLGETTRWAARRMQHARVPTRRHRQIRGPGAARNSSRPPSASPLSRRGQPPHVAGPGSAAGSRDDLDSNPIRPLPDA